MIRVITFFCFLLLPFISIGQWSQLGSDIDGETEGDGFGFSVSLNANGTLMAVGAIKNEINGGNTGQTSIFEWNGTDWTQLGATLNGAEENDFFGYSISISANGNIVAVGAPSVFIGPGSSGYTRVFEWNGTSWVQRGLDLIGEAHEDFSGYGLSLSANGNIIAIGAIGNDGNGGSSGHTRIYKWNGTNWIQLGTDIDGEAAYDFSGTALSLNSDGTIVVIGASGNSANGDAAGHVRIYEWDGTVWNQKGVDIDGETGDAFGKAVSIDASGTTISVGATGDFAKGYTNIYEWNGNNWAQKGTSIHGADTGDFLGSAGCLSKDGKVIAVGAYGGLSGYARIYKFNGTDWEQQGEDIIGEAVSDQFGNAISVNEDGSSVAIGAWANSGNGLNAGNVRVFQNPILAGVKILDQLDVNYYPNPTNNIVHINAQKSIEFIVVFNSLGREVLIKNGSSNKTELDLSNLPGGIYRAMIHTQDAAQSISLIKL